MANPTTNYSFQMPTNTDLVKDLPADFEVFGQAVDTQMKTNADAAIAKTIVDAKGDIIAATAADTVSRLAVGANDTVLTADSSTATGLKWAAVAGGGMTLLSTTTLTGANTDITSISQSYNTLEVWIYGVTNATANSVFFIFPKNGSTNLDSALIAPDGGSSPSGLTFGGRVTGRLSGDVSDFTMDRTSSNNFWVVRFANYASTTNHKSFEIIGGYYTTNGVYYGRFALGAVNSNSAINQLRFQNNGGDFNSGTVKVYGVK